MENKKFEIHEPRKFRIEEESGVEEKKRFRIHSEEGPSIRVEWFRQENENDCGPCLLLNYLQILGVENSPSSIQEIRDEINRLRREHNEEELLQDGWFRSKDIGRYLSEVIGLNVEEHPVYPYEKEKVRRRVRESIEREPYDFMYVTDNQHFRGVLKDFEGKNLLLDSFKEGPEEREEDEINRVIEKNIEKSGERYERIGLVREDGPAEYRVIS